MGVYSAISLHSHDQISIVLGQYPTKNITLVNNIKKVKSNFEKKKLLNNLAEIAVCHVNLRLVWGYID